MREVEALRVAPGPAREVVEDELRDVDEHQARQDLADAEARLQEGRDEAVERAAGDRRAASSPAAPSIPASVPWVREREPAAEHRADHELALRADVPEIGAEAVGEADRDERERRRLDERAPAAPKGR